MARLPRKLPHSSLALLHQLEKDVGLLRFQIQISKFVDGEHIQAGELLEQLPRGTVCQARTDVAMKKRFTSLSFESVRFIDLFNDWWTNHGSRTRSKFQYRTPRVVARFEKKKPAKSLRTRFGTFSRSCGRKVLRHLASTSAGPSSAASSTMRFASKDTIRTR